MLPDSQMDRFMVRLSLGYPSRKDEANMVLSRQKGNPLAALTPLFTASQVEHLRSLVAQTYIGEPVVNYIVELIDATRHHEDILRGASPRATLALTSMAKAIAQLRGRDYVVPVDVKEVFVTTIAHRLLLTPKAESRGVTPDMLLRQILERISAPKLR